MKLLFQGIGHIVEEIVAKEKSDVRLALVAFHGVPSKDGTFVTELLDFTPSVSRMRDRLEACEASGGAGFFFWFFFLVFFIDNLFTVQ